MKKVLLPIFLFLYISGAYAVTLPTFIDKSNIDNATIVCMNPPAVYSNDEQKYVDTLWKESMTFLEGYATALTTSINKNCINSDKAIYETKGLKTQCIMDNIDMQLMVRHIYAVLNNQNSAKRCFNVQKGTDWMFTPSKTVENSSPVAKWLKRPLLSDYYSKKSDLELKKAGMNYAENFHKMTTNSSINMPETFPFDISAKALPNLWASVGWVPMYSGDDERAQNVGHGSMRGGYAYGEIMGHWGLLQIKTINNIPVGAEIGMTVQAMDTFYPFHHHAINEIYYTIRQPKCVDSVKQFVAPSTSDIFNITNSNDDRYDLSFNGSQIPNISHYWASTTTKNDPLLFIPANSIHAFDLKEHCEAKPEETAHVAVWARSNADSKVNDYGTTIVCRLKDKTVPKSSINRKNADVICGVSKFKF